MNLSNFLILAFFLSCANCYAKWDNQSERYANAYKKYAEARCPIPENRIKHFVYFARDRGAIKDHPLLKHDRFSGAQIMYLWSRLEPAEGKYDFSTIRHDYEYLKKYDKKLFVQLQDATFDPKVRGLPEYLNTSEYDGGSIEQINDHGRVDGWTAKRWNKKVHKRFTFLLEALGKEFDGKIEGINLQETAIGVDPNQDTTFTYKGYRDAIKENMLSLRKAFPQSTAMLYANFMPGEWLPWEDKGYLRSIYEYGEQIGVALAAPDLMVRRKGQLNHALAMMHEHKYSTPLGIAVQDGNYTGLTGADFSAGSDLEGNENNVVEKRKNIVPLLHAFAEDFLKVNYMFWVNQKPYFEEDVLTCFK
ncbi:hypothetical protein [Pseudoalteromonas ostreae]|uniref:hypothetical protein n=1 Tax=Pseudoalteromonas ostreae TaxID=2774154 RepID=UPI001B3605EE|nr:hypothetical protein [Pseudoalteromonas ostreae]